MWLLLTTDTVNPVSVSRARPDKRSPPPSRMAQNCRDVPSLELVPLGWEWQGVMFAILTLLAAWLWWKWLSRRVREQKHSDSHLNQRGQQLIGRRFVLESPLVNGRGHMRVGDSSWPVSASEDLGAGTHVEVIAIEGITLHIRAVSS